jgi:hypothetical protein
MTVGNGAEMWWFYRFLSLQDNDHRGVFSKHVNLDKTRQDRLVAIVHYDIWLVLL